MNLSIRTREARYAEDYPAMAAVITAERVNWPVSADELAAQDAARDPKFFYLALVAEAETGAGAEMVGVGTIGHIPYIHREGRFGLDLRVRPDWQGRGAGKALYNALMERVQHHHPDELITEVWEALPRPRRFMEDRGFQATWRRVDSTLDVRGFDSGPYANLEERLRAEGIEITTFADQARDPERARKLHALDWALLQDMPYGEPPTQLSLEHFVRETIEAPVFLPDACFIAKHGDKWVGYTNLMSGESFYTIQMTGVLAGWRGRGIATLLKLKEIDYAQKHGGLELRTTNDSVNTSIIEINHRLGFKETGAIIRYKKTIK